MQPLKDDPIRTARWRAIRRRIRLGSPAERAVLLARLADEVRALTPLAVRASRQDWDLADCLEMAAALGVVIGGWLALDPTNPEWPGRDRLYLSRRQDHIAACAVLALSGCFPVDHIARVVDSLDADPPAAVPGLELTGQPTRALARHAWESALESARSKRRWRDQVSVVETVDWVNPAWAASSAVWNACLLLDHNDESLATIRSLPNQNGDKPAGLVVLVSVPREDAIHSANQWRECGWEALVVSRNDVCELYNCLQAPRDARPVAIMLTAGDDPELGTSGTVRRASESILLGELPDDQFKALMDETLRF